MADATDLKSVDRKVVWVRLPPSAGIYTRMRVTLTLFGLDYIVRPPIRNEEPQEAQLLLPGEP